MNRIFEWDENKNQANILKHGVGFEEAIQIFDNSIYSIIDTRHDYGETKNDFYRQNSEHHRCCGCSY